jgi:site-specific DNA recombinase
MDRLARNLKLLLTIWDDLEACGCDVVTVKESIDTTIPTGRLIRNVLGAIAEFERDTILERTLAGKHVKVTQRGGHAVHSPYGYRLIRRDRSSNTPGYLEVDTTTASVVRRIFELMTAGHSTTKIAETFTREAIPTPKGSRRGPMLPLRKSSTIPSTMVKLHTGSLSSRARLRTASRYVSGRPRRTSISQPFRPPWTGHCGTRLTRNWAIIAGLHGATRSTATCWAGLVKCGLCNHTMSGVTNGQLVYYRCSHTTPDASRVVHSVQLRC